MPKSVWNIEAIKAGVDRYYLEHGHYPTADDFDECSYLPSARQVQRKFGGMETLRNSLGLAETNYTKGDSRRTIYSNFAERSLQAEDTLEQALVDYFGEPYVHTQKRYYRLMKNRWDFFVYYRGGYFGIDIFSTARQSNIMKNVGHKLSKYADVPSTTQIFFIVDAPADILESDVVTAIAGSRTLKQRPNITVQLLSTFLSSTITEYKPLELPTDIKLVL